LAKIEFTRDNTASAWRKTIGFATMILIWGMFAMYEYWAEPKYWKNRWRLWKAIRKGKVKHLACDRDIEEILMYPKKLIIERHLIEIDGRRYELDIWSGHSMTLNDDHRAGSSYIGLFTGSITTNILNRHAIRSIRNMADKGYQRDQKLKKLGI
jgi:hypothetical protein